MEGMTMSFIINCPNCSQELEAEDEYVNMEMECPACCKRFVIHKESLNEGNNNKIPETICFAGNSPDGAINKTLLADFSKIINHEENEELFFFHKSTSPAMELPGFIKPSYHIAITSKRIIAIAKSKAGKISRKDYRYENVKSASFVKGFISDDLVIIIKGSPDQKNSYSFVNNSKPFKPEHLPATVEFIRNIKGGFPESDTGGTENNLAPLAEVSTELSAIEKIRFKKFLSENGGMTNAEVDNYLATVSDDERKSLIFSFKNIQDKNNETRIQTPNSNQPVCPKCKSIKTTYGQQGYGVGKAALGVLFTGGIGLLAGGIGKNNILITCLECGYSWGAGDDKLQAKLDSLRNPLRKDNSGRQ